MPEGGGLTIRKDGLNLVEAVAGSIATFALCPYGIAACVKKYGMYFGVLVGKLPMPTSTRNVVITP